MTRSSGKGKFVVATPARSVCDDNARVLEKQDLLRFIALGTRRGAEGVSPQHTRLNPKIGLASYIAAKTLSAYQGESFRFRLLPWFDHWVKKQLVPGDHIISSYGYVNESFKWIRRHGGTTFLDGGNSHPENYWSIVAEEHRRWKSPCPPLPPHWSRRAVEMMPEVDYVLSPSTFVTDSFLARGFRAEQILRNVYPLDLSCFTPLAAPRPANRPLTLISTGSLSLRKGTPYLLEAFRIVRKQIPDARLLLTDAIADSAKPVIARYRDLPIDWAPSLPHSRLAERLRSADLFLLPSLEDGFARTVAEALACGLPAITTLNTGASDLIQPGINGEIVPIRDSLALADVILNWAPRILNGNWQPMRQIDPNILSVSHFETTFIGQLQKLGMVDPLS